MVVRARSRTTDRTKVRIVRSKKTERRRKEGNARSNGFRRGTGCFACTSWFVPVDTTVFLGWKRILRASNTMQQLDYLGTAIFALNATIQAREKRVGPIGCVTIAIFTSMAGSTLRDLLLGHAPVIWIRRPEYVVLSALTSLATMFVLWGFPGLRPTNGLMQLLESIGLGAFAVVGTHATRQLHCSPMVAMLSGLLMATFGVFIKDVVLGRSPASAGDRGYVTPVLAGSMAYQLALGPCTLRLACLIGICCTVLMRSVHFRLN